MEAKNGANLDRRENDQKIDDKVGHQNSHLPYEIPLVKSYLINTRSPV